MRSLWLLCALCMAITSCYLTEVEGSYQRSDNAIEKRNKRSAIGTANVGDSDTKESSVSDLRDMLYDDERSAYDGLMSAISAMKNANYQRAKLDNNDEDAQSSYDAESEARRIVSLYHI